jgi:hypothetical protein
MHLFSYPLLSETHERIALIYILSLYLVLLPFPLSFNAHIPVKVARVSAVILLVLTVIVLFSGNRKTNELAGTSRMVIGRNWRGIISKYERNKPADLRGRYYYNLALSEEGLLCDRLFAGNKEYLPGALTLPREKQYLDDLIYFYYSTGLITEVQHLATESIVVNGFRYETLYHLIKAEMLAGNYKVARRYCEILKETKYRDRSEKLMKLIGNPSLIPSDPDLGEKLQFCHAVIFL